jgi:hypothetical protein
MVYLTYIVMCKNHAKLGAPPSMGPNTLLSNWAPQSSSLNADKENENLDLGVRS